VRPALELSIVEWDAVAAAGEDQHRGADQLIADVSGRTGVPRPGSDAGGLGKDVVTAIGDLAQFLDGFVQVARSAAYRIAVPWRRCKATSLVDMPQLIERSFDLRCLLGSGVHEPAPAASLRVARMRVRATASLPRVIVPALHEIPTSWDAEK
jgi:hypothetical protein